MWAWGEGERMNIADDLHDAYEQGYAEGMRDAVKHGHWINSGYACGETDWECSVCHCHEYRTGATEYCMRCGALMDEVSE